MRIAVSVCVSVHNTAKYLPRCLDCLVSQTLKELEIVLVNNGSSDNSEEIMYEYSNKYPERRIVILSQQDLGLAQGRQTGINNAHGKYLSFLDADDLIEPNAYQELYECAERFNVDIVEMDTKRDGAVLDSPFNGVQDTHDILRIHFSEQKLQPMLWLRLYKRSLFDIPVLPTFYTNNEDMFAVPCLFHKAKNIYFLHKPFHTYSTDNEGGYMKVTTTNPAFAEKHYKNRLTVLKSLAFFEDYVGNNICEYDGSYNHYKSNLINSVIFYPFKGKSKWQKIKDAAEVLSFSNDEALISYIVENINRDTKVGKWINQYGYNIAYIISTIKQKISAI